MTKKQTTQQMLDVEKRQRAKGLHDPQMAEMVEHMRSIGVQNVFDVQAAYDSDFLGLKDRCAFGARGLCCRNCNLGPCRLASEDMPHHMQAVSPVLNRSTCGKTADSMVASMQLSTALRGAAGHMAHAMDVLETFHAVAWRKTDQYQLADTAKLEALAGQLGIPTDDTDPYVLAQQVAAVAQADLFGGLGMEHETMSFFEAYAAKDIDKIRKAGIVPVRGAAVQVMRMEHATQHGMMSNTFELLRACLKLGLLDTTSLFMATQLQDVMLGTPSPGLTRMGMDNLKADMVNIVVHGHNPLFSEKIVEHVADLEEEAKAAGATGINVLAICCTGNELGQRRGVPLAGNNLHQELVMATGVVDGMVVDYQCAFPTLSVLAERYHTRLITTHADLRMENETYVPFRADKASEDARHVIGLCIEAFKNRDPSQMRLPSTPGQEMLMGFSAEACIGVLSKLDADDPLAPLVALIKDGTIRGVAAIVGCTSARVQSDMSHVRVARRLLKENVLVLATGCAAGALARNGMLMPAATEEWAGESLAAVLSALGKAAGLDGPLPPVWHMGSCVDNSRVLSLATAIADHIGVPVDALPVVGAAPEAVTEKADAIALGVLSHGISVLLGVVPKWGGSPFVERLLGTELHGILGSRVFVNPDPEAGAELLLAHIDAKRAELGI